MNILKLFFFFSFSLNTCIAVGKNCIENDKYLVVTSGEVGEANRSVKVYIKEKKHSCKNIPLRSTLEINSEFVEVDKLLGQYLVVLTDIGEMPEHEVYDLESKKKLFQFATNEISYGPPNKVIYQTYSSVIYRGKNPKKCLERVNKVAKGSLQKIKNLKLVNCNCDFVKNVEHAIVSYKRVYDLKTLSHYYTGEYGCSFLQ